MKATLTIEIEYDPEVTDAESMSSALDTLMETALSSPGILDEYGGPSVGMFYVQGDCDDNGNPVTQEDTRAMLRRYEDLSKVPEEDLIALCKELEKGGDKKEIVRFLDDAINAFASARDRLSHARRRLS